MIAFGSLCRLFVILSLGVAAAAQGTVFYVNPQPSIGVNAPGGGGSGSPFLTIGYALTQPFTAPLTLNLEPGTYSRQTNGESFPVVLPANVMVRGTQAVGVTLANSAPPFNPGFALKVTLSNPSDFCVFEDFRVTGNCSAIRIRSTGTGPHAATVSRVTTRMTGGSSNESQGILVSSDVFLDYRQSDCHSTDNDRCLTLSARAPIGHLFARVERCHFGAYSSTVLPGTAIRAEAEAAAQLTTFINNTSFNERVRGVQTVADPAGQMLMLMRHATARRLGTQVLVGGLGTTLVGGLIDDAALPPSLIWQVENCAMFDNVVEINNYSPTTHFLTTNLVQDAALLSAPGGQISGDPLWADPMNDDFHLLPGSPCIGAATAGSIVTEDRDGDDRTQACAGGPDIGLDETFDWDFYTGDGDGIGLLGSSEEVRFYGDGGAILFFAAGFGDPSAQCADPKLFYAPGIFFLISGLVLPGNPGTQSTVTSAIPIPPASVAPALSGASFDLATFFVSVTPAGIPSLWHSAELRRIKILP